MAPTTGGKALILKKEKVTGEKKKEKKTILMLDVSPGQYHWVSEFSPRNYQQILSYVVGKTFKRHLSIQKNTARCVKKANTLPPYNKKKAGSESSAGKPSKHPSDSKPAPSCKAS